MFWRSKEILEWPEWAFVRGLFKSMGYSDYDLARPLVGIANSWNRAVPGHYNLNLVSDYVKQGIFQAGGTPVEFGVIGACDGIANGHVGMHYVLPTRDLIAHDVEMMVEAHQLDAVVLLGSVWISRRFWLQGARWQGAVNSMAVRLTPRRFRKG
jgi:dihydroxy-acid dehydratase